MKTIKILALDWTLPKFKSATTIMLKKVTSSLEKKYNVQIIWFIYTDKKISEEVYENEKIFDIHEFENGLKAIQKINPDIIFIDNHVNLIHCALAIAGKFLKIPVVTVMSTGIIFSTSSVNNIIMILKLFFQKSLPLDSGEEKFMKRGRYFLSKLKFLIKTQRAIKYKWLRIFQESFSIIKDNISNDVYSVNPKFANDVNCIHNKKLYEKCIKSGFNESCLVLTGSPLFDDLFTRIQKLKTPKNSGKIRVLLITFASYEHGIWSKSQRKMVIEKIVKKLDEHKNRIELTIKIHPSSEVLKDYENIVTPINQQIAIHQSGDVLDYIEQSDIVISFSAGSSVLPYVIISKKPLILCNFLKEDTNEYLERGLAIECNNPEKLDEMIFNYTKMNPVKNDNTEKFIENVFYKGDGQAGYRIAEVIIKLLENNKQDKK